MDQDRIGILLAKYMAGELAPEEQAELELNLLANPELRAALQALRGLHERPPGGISGQEEGDMLEKGLQRFKALDAARYKKLLRAVEPQEEGAGNEVVKGEGVGNVKKPVEVMPAIGGGIQRAGLRTWRLRWMAAAAVLVVLLSGVLYYYQPKYNYQAKGVVAAATPKAREIHTKYGTRSYQELPDGSKLWLNAGSKVLYAENFADGKRELTLTGEAFFDIRHDPAHPFIIHAGKLNIRVLGTTLNVKAYTGDPVIETTLISGKVEVDDEQQQAIVLHPNEKVAIPVGTEDHSDGEKKMAQALRRPVAPDSAYRTIPETSWVEDKLFFRNETMSEVAVRMERWYNIQLQFDNDKYQQQILTGYFKDQPVENVMKALQVLLRFHYRIDKDTIHIW